MRRRSSTVLGCSGTNRCGGSCPGIANKDVPSASGAVRLGGLRGRLRFVGARRTAAAIKADVRTRANGAVDLTMITSPLVE